MKIEVNQLRDCLESPKDSASNQIRASCPFCHKSDKFFINRLTFLWDCKKCGEKGNLFKLLKHLGRLDLIIDGKTVENFERLPPLFAEVFNKIEVAEEVDMPLGFQRVYRDDYLDSRGFVEYERYPVGVAIEHKYNGFVIFQVLEDNICVAFLGRNKMSKKEIDAINATNERLGKKEILRWDNSKNDFSKLIYGIDEITSETKLVVIVESVFGKINADRFLSRNNLELIKCVSVFGSKVSEHQIFKLLQKGVEDVVLLFDADAVDKTKLYANELNCFFNSVKVGVIRHGEDIDNFTDDDFNRVIFDDSVSVFEYSNTVLKCNLKLT